jgi:hypothetical protein
MENSFPLFMDARKAVYYKGKFFSIGSNRRKRIFRRSRPKRESSFLFWGVYYEGKKSFSVNLRKASLRNNGLMALPVCMRCIFAIRVCNLNPKIGLTWMGLGFFGFFRVFWGQGLEDHFNNGSGWVQTLQ